MAHRDLLLVTFMIAFALPALNQAVVTLSDIPLEERSLLYLVRLAAFALIVVAILHKNRDLGPMDR